MIARKSLLIVLNNVIGGILGFVSLYFITTKMGAEELGILGFGLSFVGMFTFISVLGFDTAHNKRISEGKDLAACLGTYIRIKLRLTVLMAVVSLAAIVIYGYGFGMFENDTQAHVTFIFLIYYILWSLSIIAITTFNALRKQAKAQLPSILEFFIRSPTVILLAILGYGIVSVAVIYVVGMGALLLLAFYFFKGLPVSSEPDPELTRSYLEFAKPMAVIAFTTSMSLYLDKVMLASISGNTQVGVFYGAQQIVRFFIVSSAPLAVLLFPTISSYHSQGKLKDIRNMVLGAERYLAMAVIPAIAVLVALSAPVMKIFGKDYDSPEAAWTLVYLAFFSLVYILNKPISQIITGSGNTTLAVKIAVSVLVLNFMLNIVLIPDWDFMPSSILGIGILHGAAGAAVATFLAEILRFAVARWKSGAIVGYRMRYVTMCKFLAAACIAGVAVYWLHFEILSPDSPLFLPLEMAAGLLIYLAVLVLLGEFTRDDYRFFMDLVHPGKMKDYIHGEITGKDDEITGKDDEMGGKDNEMAGKDNEMAGKDNEITGKDR